VWLLTRPRGMTISPPPKHTWIAFVNWLRGAPEGYKYPREDDEIDLRPYDR
jgi:hypothetical protein